MLEFVTAASRDGMCEVEGLDVGKRRLDVISTVGYSCKQDGIETAANYRRRWSSARRPDGSWSTRAVRRLCTLEGSQADASPGANSILSPATFRRPRVDFH